MLRPGAAALALLLILWAGTASDAVHSQSALPEGNPRAGAQIYESVCKGCHGVSIAPTLRGVVGRPIASVDSYTGYSDALRARGDMTWTRENLSNFLRDPAAFAPGTEMVQVIADEEKRADLIAFLEMLPPPRQ